MTSLDVGLPYPLPALRALVGAGDGSPLRLASGRGVGDEDSLSKSSHQVVALGRHLRRPAAGCAREARQEQQSTVFKS